jgi:hypothetical protein
MTDEMAYSKVRRVSIEEVQAKYPPSRAALVIGVCRRCGRRDRMLSREDRVCVREEYDKDVLAFVAKPDPTCKEKRAWATR